MLGNNPTEAGFRRRKRQVRPRGGRRDKAKEGKSDAGPGEGVKHDQEAVG